MAPRSLLWPDPRVKPPFGAAEVDWGHRLAQKLVAGFFFTEGGGTMLLGGASLYGTSVASSWEASARWPAMIFNGSTTKISFPTVTPLSIPNPGEFSIVVDFFLNGAGTINASLYSLRDGV